MSKSFFLGKKHAAAYAKYRPTPPGELMERIVQFVQEKIPPPLSSAVDVGCGSGQSTLSLSPHFQHVLGTDVSNSQLTQASIAAENVTNVDFSVARAEELPLENGTVQLITASQCFHWFDADKFYTEAKRVLVPNGVLAVYGYCIPVIKTGNEDSDRRSYDHLMKLYTGPLGSYFDSARKMVDSKYSTVRLPFANAQRVDNIWSSKSSSLADYQGYLTSWSAYRGYVKGKGQQSADRLLTDFTKGMLEILRSPRSAEDTIVQVDIEYFLLMGRNTDSKNA